MDLTEMTFEELKLVAEQMKDFKYDKRTGESKLRDLMTAFLEVDPDCLKAKESDGTGEVMTPIIGEIGTVQNITDEGNGKGEIPDIKPSEKGMVKVQSIHRGKISTSFGIMDFGTDGIVEISAEAADYLCEIPGYEKC